MEARILETFARHSIPLCVGVIPFQERAGRRVTISRETSHHLFHAHEENRIEIALHGHSHIRRKQSPNGDSSEFANVELETQTALIAEAQTALSEFLGRPVAGFIPPFNTYDLNTLRLLRIERFAYLSGSVAGGCARLPGIAVLPATASLRNAGQGIAQAMRFARWSPTVIIYFHPDDFIEYRDPPAPGERGPFTSIAELDALLAWARNQGDCEFVTLGSLAQRIAAARSRLHQPEARHMRLLPARFGARIPRLLLLDSRAHALLIGVTAPFVAS